MNKNHYRWDFIGLSTDEKPTPDTSLKVCDGSTFYCSDTSKLYVWYNDRWYEKTSTGGGGGSASNIENGTGTKSLQQLDNQSLGTNSIAVGEGTIAAGKWAFAEGRGNNFEVTCLSTLSSPVSYMVVSGEKSDEIRKNAVIFYDNSFRYVTKVENYYLPIPAQAQAPEFEPDKYYRSEGPNNYEVLETEPLDWETNYTHYFYIGGYTLTLNDTITSTQGDTVKVFMGAALASNSHSSGTFCNTVYLGSTTLTDEDYVNRNSAEGSRTLATGYAAKAIGEYSRAVGKRSFAAGYGPIATGDDSVALNHNTQANAKFSTAIGDTTLANCQGGLAVGKYNAGSSFALFEVGNGSTTARNTAFEVNTNGKAYTYTNVEDNDGDYVVANKKYVDRKLPSNIINNIHDGTATDSLKQQFTTSPNDNQVSLGKYNYNYRKVVSSFTLDTAKTGGQMLLRIGQYSGGSGTQGTTYTFYNPRLKNITTGEEFDITLSNSTISGYNTSANRKWNLRGGSSSDMKIVTVDGQTGINIRSDLGWRYAEYRWDSCTLPIGDYEITVDSPTLSTISHLSTANIWYQNTKISSDFSYTNIAFVIGNGISGNDKNAFVVLTDGSGKIQKQGLDNDSIVQKQYVDNILKNITGYSTTGTQVLKCIDGVIQWVSE